MEKKKRQGGKLLWIFSTENKEKREVEKICVANIQVEVQTFIDFCYHVLKIRVLAVFQKYELLNIDFSKQYWQGFAKYWFYLSIFLLFVVVPLFSSFCFPFP